MMDALTEFPRKMLKLLLMKEQEYGQLRYILSQATEETSRVINELLEAVTKIAIHYDVYNVKIFFENDSSKPCINISPAVIGCYNYFVLNTNFSSQSFFIEDLLLGHIVNAWPTISPYLFIRMIWHMKCEELLIESLMHLPLDLCVDILDVTIRCINELEIPRAKRFVFLLICKLYYKCLWMHLGVLSIRDITEIVSQLVAHFQTLLDVIGSKFITLELSNQKRYVQHGILIKEILRYVKTCMHYKTKNFPIANEELKLFEITYGNTDGRTDHFYMLPIDKVKSIIETLDQELVTLLLNQIKQVDCFEFMDWAEINDDDNVTISLQRAIIIECYFFMEFMKQNEFLSTNDHLQHCLEQLVGPVNPEESILSLEELCHSIANGKLDDMKELIKYYKKWDLSVLNFISSKTELLNTKDVGILLEYLHYMFEHTHDYEKKQNSYILVLKVLMEQQLSDMYSIILKYTLQHFHDNRLIFLFNNEHFKKFIEGNVNMHDHKELRVILIFIMLNPKRVLSTLVRVAIGSTEIEYRNVMFKRPQIYFLQAFFVSKLDGQNNLLTYLLNDAWLYDHSTWCYKQFEAFMNGMIQEEAMTADDLLNSVYIPCLTANDIYNFSNLLSMLIHMYSILKKNICTRSTNYTLLVIELAKKMSMIRKCNLKNLRSTVNNLLDRGMIILNFIFARSDLLMLKNQIEIMNKVNNFVEPIDQLLLAPLLQKILHGTVQDVIQNYERRCSAPYQHSNLQCMSKLRDSFQLDKKILLRHMMLHATEGEYKNFAIEITIVSWSYFGYANELDAYENVLHITAEAMQLVLMFTNTFSKDAFVSLLRALVCYCNALLFLKHQMCKNEEVMFNILLRTLLSLKSTVDRTQYGKIYDSLLEQINMCVNSNSKVTNYFCKISELIEVYFVRSEGIENGSSYNLECESLSHSVPTEDEMIDMFKEYQFVCECINDTSYGKKVLRS